MTLELEAGRSTIIIGANGSGKTRLGVYLESSTKPSSVATHRIAAQKSLAFIDTIQITDLNTAEHRLLTGNTHKTSESYHSKINARWGNNPAVHPLSDFEALLQTLFAEQARVAVQYIQTIKINPATPAPTPKLHQLQQIWESLLPHRRFIIQETTLRVTPSSAYTGMRPKQSAAPTPSSQQNDTYFASQMSDGERAIFYYIGQCLLARQDSIIIIDEPENHIHKAILGRLWATLESTRPDCAFVYITHDLDFATEQPARSKYFLRSHNPEINSRDTIQGHWDIEELPDETSLPQQVVAEIIGSRKPILFVEGTKESLDLTIYRNCYAEFSIIPVGACDNVINSVRTCRNNPTLHRQGPAHGVVDADDRTESEIEHLRNLGVHVLPVAELENILLLPDVFTALAEALHCGNIPGRLTTLTEDIMTSASSDIESTCALHTIRRIDRKLKRVTISAKNLTTLQSSFASELSDIKPAELFTDFRTRIDKHIQDRDLQGVLALYSNKGLLARAATKLGLRDRKELLDKIARLLGGTKNSTFASVLAKTLPGIHTDGTGNSKWDSEV
ncbi:AAA family ATPase [Myxococcus sp. AB025B]|uniref:AAA family ATPase n=1 Tax=Myxococcus sp. AB025B TaxID=2562794 RepID=UPI0018917907|nr:AAA family ATPase [Myxococcus sp. AB025B]